MSQNNLYILSIGATLFAGLIGSLLARIVSKNVDEMQDGEFHKTRVKEFATLQRAVIIFALVICFILEIKILDAVYQETEQYIATQYLFWIVPFVVWIAVSVFTSSLRHKLGFWIITVPITIFSFFQALQSFAIGGWFVLLLLIVALGLGISKLRQDFLRSK